jgi:hypothetical protein
VDVATSEFAGEPQPVEIYHRGIWYSGELLGWRHDTDGRCLARVRCVVNGLRHRAWKDLSDLRLPAPPPPVTPRPEAVSIRTRRTDSGTWRADDETRPHVLLADLQARPRPPAHALTPPAPRVGTAEPPAHDPAPTVDRRLNRFADRSAVLGERLTAV